MGSKYIKAPSNRKLIEKLRKEGMPSIGEIENLLIYQQSLSQKIRNKSKNNKLANQKGINFTEAMKFIYNFNKKATKSINVYHTLKKDNDKFLASMDKFKHRNKILPSIEQEKVNYIFSNLIKKYEKRGINVTRSFIDSDIYKKNGLLLSNTDIYHFYKFDILDQNEKDKKAEKNMDFLVKIKRQAQRMYNKKLIESKKLEEENEKFIFFNNENKQIVKPIQPPDEKKPEPIRKRQSLFNFVNRVNIIIREIKDEKKEIKKLKKLILEEEKFIQLQKRKMKEQNNMNNNMNNNLNKNNNNSISKNEESSYIRTNKRKKARTINPIFTKNFNSKSTDQIANNNKSNNDGKNKLISEESKILSSTENINKENTTMHTNTKNNLNTLISDSTNLTNNNINEYKNRKLLYKIYNNLSLAKIMRRRLSSIPYLNISNQSNNSESRGSIPSGIAINLRKKRRSSLQIPKNLKRDLTVDETYEKIANLDFISLEKDTDIRREKVNTLLKKYYGRRYQEYNKKNNHIKILNNYERLKNEIINSEKKNTIYAYSAVLPKAMQKRIEYNLEQNEKLKNYGSEYIKSFYEKKLNDE